MHGWTCWQRRGKYIYIYNSHSDRDALIHVYVHNRPNVNNIKNRFALGSLTPVSLRSRACFLQGYHLTTMQPDSCVLPHSSDAFRQDIHREQLAIAWYKNDLDKIWCRTTTIGNIVLQPRGQHHLFTVAPYIVINRKRVRDNYIAINTRSTTICRSTVAFGYIIFGTRYL